MSDTIPMYRAGAASPPPPPHVAAVRDRAVAAFVEDLRSLVLDRSLTATLAGRDTDDDPVSSLAMEPADLRAWRGWSGDGRAFLETLRDDEPLDNALTPYKALVVEFVAWVSKWQAAVHRGALEELADLRRGHNGDSQSSGRSNDVATVPASWLASRHLVHAS